MNETNPSEEVNLAEPQPQPEPKPSHSKRLIAPIIILLIILAVFAVTKFQNRSVSVLTSNPNLFSQIHEVEKKYPYNFQPFTVDNFLERIDTKNDLLISSTRGGFYFSSAKTGEVKGRLSQPDFGIYPISRIFILGPHLLTFHNSSLLEFDYKGNVTASTTLPNAFDPKNSRVLTEINKLSSEPYLFVSGNQLWNFYPSAKKLLPFPNTGLSISDFSSLNIVSETKNTIWIRIGNSDYAYYNKATNYWTEVPPLPKIKSEFSTDPNIPTDPNIALFSGSDEYAFAVDYEQNHFLYTKKSNSWKSLPKSKSVYVDERMGGGILNLQDTHAYYFFPHYTNSYFGHTTSTLISVDLSKDPNNWEPINIPGNVTHSFVNPDSDSVLLQTEDGKILTLKNGVIQPELLSLPNLNPLSDIVAIQDNLAIFKTSLGYGTQNLTTNQNKFYKTSQPTEGYANTQITKKIGDTIYILEGLLDGYAQVLHANIIKINIISGEITQAEFTPDKANCQDCYRRLPETDSYGSDVLDLGITNEGEIYLKSNQKNDSAEVFDWSTKTFNPVTKQFSKIPLENLFDDDRFKQAPYAITRNSTYLARVLHKPNSFPTLTIEKKVSKKTIDTIPVDVTSLVNLDEQTPLDLTDIKVSSDETTLWLVVNNKLIQVNTQTKKATQFKNTPQSLQQVFLNGNNLILQNQNGFYDYKQSDLQSE